MHRSTTPTSKLKTRATDDLRRQIDKRRAEDEHVREWRASTPGEASLGDLHRRAERLQERRHADPTPTRVSTVPPPRRSELPVAAEPPGFRTVQWAEGASYQLMEVVQGGAAVWAAAPDGTVDVCCGGDTVVHSIEASPAGTPVTALCATAGHVWIGGDDGTVRVYDHMVFVHITEGQFHAGAVTCFAETYDGRMLSASEDGSVVRWDTEHRGFEAMSQVMTDHAAGITCIAHGGDLVFTGSSDTTIQVLELPALDTVAELRGHRGAITSLAYLNGFLFSGALDETLCVWDTATHHEAQAHSIGSDVLCVVADRATARVWTGDRAGNVCMWFATAEAGFAKDRDVAQYDHPVLVLRTMCAVDAMRVWSLASDGVNKVWYTCRNRVEEHMGRTVAALKAVMTQDHHELARWTAVVQHLASVNAQRRHALGRVLMQRFNDALRRRYIHRWQHYLAVVQARRRKQSIAVVLAQTVRLGAQRRFYAQWLKYARAVQAARVKKQYVTLLARSNETAVVQEAFTRMQAFVRHVKAAARRKSLGAIFGAQMQRSAGRRLFRQWVKFATLRRQAAARLAYVGAVLRVTEGSLRRVYFHSWVQALERRRALQQRQAMCALLVGSSAVGLRCLVFDRWLLFRAKRQAAARRLRVASCLLGSMDRVVMATYLRKLAAHRHARIVEREHSNAAAAEDSLAVVRAKYAGLQAVVAERKALAALERELQEKRERMAAQEVALRQLECSREDFVQRAAAEAAARVATAKDEEEQLEDLFAELKGRALNLHLDYSLLQSVKERAAKGSAQGVFQEALAGVRRIVLDASTAPLGGPEPWPLSRGKLTKLPPHQWGPLHANVKTLAIAFDLLDRDEGLPSDAECLANAEWLLLIADLATEQRRKALHRPQPGARPAARGSPRPSPRPSPRR